MVLVLSGLWLVSSPSLLKAADTATIPRCMIEPDQAARIPGQEAGVLTKILVREGDQVAAGQLLAQIDDIIPQAQKDVAKYKLAVAKRQAEDDIDVQFATAAAKVAEAEVREAQEANAKTEGAFPRAEVRRRLLEWTKMDLSILKSKKDMAVAALQAKVAEAELNAATANVERRRIVAPLDADRDRAQPGNEPAVFVVVEFTKHLGEWVQIGEPVMRLVRLDRLRVNGVLDPKEYRPSEIRGCPVRIAVDIPHVAKPLEFSGRIVYVNPVIEGGMFQVRAEVQNREQNGVWILNPGMIAKMTIELKQK
jgi:multidrug efflux pump subunit AcrA (membrane-fusion protein)